MGMVVVLVLVVVVCPSRCFDHPEICEQEAYQAYQSPSPSSAASPLTVMKAPSAGQLAMPMGNHMVCWPGHLQSFAHIHPPPLQGPKSAPKIEAARASRSSLWTALGVASWAACSALGQAGSDV